MRPRKSTWIWLAVLCAAEVLAWILEASSTGENGCLTLAAQALALNAAFILVWRATAFLFRLIIRRLALRLAFSYFLIGVVPIPLLTALLFLVTYVVAHQYMATRVRREITAIGESAAVSAPAAPRVALSEDGSVKSSGVPGLEIGATIPGLKELARPGFLELQDRLWLAVPEGHRTLRLLDLSASEATWVQALADKTGYAIEFSVAETRTKHRGFQFNNGDEPVSAGLQVRSRKGAPASPERRPRAADPPGRGIWNGEWVHAFYLETLVNAADAEKQTGHNVAIVVAKASPRLVEQQLFSQGVAGIGGVFWIVILVIGALLLVVYLVALLIAFVLAGSIVRNVNRLTRAAQAVSRGDLSVRVQSKSRDQIGDLARSFDGMADSIQRLLAETAHKERLESEIEMARTIQHKLLPPLEASLGGVRVLAHFEPVAAIGGDYYDYLPMPDGRTAIALGDVSGHGLPTGLLVAMAKAALSTLIEAGHQGSELFERLNDLIYRATDPRHYMTLCLLAYDASRREGTLTNAGQLAPYRVCAGRVESLALPAFPLGLFPDKTFPSKSYTLASGDLLVFHSDGFVEATDASDEPFGFERFEALLRSHATDGPQALKDAILSAVAEHTGSRSQDDDRTLLILSLD